MFHREFAQKFGDDTTGEMGSLISDYFKWAAISANHLVKHDICCHILGTFLHCSNFGPLGQVVCGHYEIFVSSCCFWQCSDKVESPLFESSGREDGMQFSMGECSPPIGLTCGTTLTIFSTIFKQAWPEISSGEYLTCSRVGGEVAPANSFVAFRQDLSCFFLIDCSS